MTATADDGAVGLDPWVSTNPFLAAMLDGMRTGGHRVACIEAESHTLRSVKPRLSYGEDVRIVVSGPLGRGILVLQELVDHGDLATVTDLRSPNPEPLWWQVLGWAQTQRGLLLVGAHDQPGLAGLVHSPTIGPALSRALQRTQHEGIKGRIRRARRTIGDDDTVRAVTASAANEYLVGDAESDRGFPVHDFWVTEFDATTREWTPVAARARQGSGGTPRRRRAGLNAAVLRAFEGEAFGAGIDSARAKDRPVSFDADPADVDREALSRFESDTAREEILRRFEAALDAEEFQLYQQKRDDPGATQVTHGKRLGWGVKRVRAVDRRLSAKAQEFNAKR